MFNSRAPYSVMPRVGDIVKTSKIGSPEHNQIVYVHKIHSSCGGDIYECIFKDGVMRDIECVRECSSFSKWLFKQSTVFKVINVSNCLKGNA